LYAVNHDQQRGTNYIRWGRKTCEGNATLVYKGMPILYHLYCLSLLYVLGLEKPKLLKNILSP